MKRFFTSGLVKYALFSLWALLFLSASSWVLVGSVAYWVQHGWLPPDSAGWAQALGGLLAVIVAIAVPAFQNLNQARQQKEKEELARVEGIQATRALVEHVTRAHRRLHTALSRVGTRGLYGPQSDGRAAVHEAMQAAAMLREFSVVDLSVQMVHFVVSLREIANYGEFVGSQFERFELAGSAGSEVLSQIRSNIETMKKWVTELDELEDAA